MEDKRIAVSETLNAMDMSEFRKLIFKVDELQQQVSHLSRQFQEHVTVCQTSQWDHSDDRKRGSKSPDIGGRRRHRTSENHKQACLRKSLQTNIVMLIDDLPFTESELGDMLISAECLTEDECGDLRRCPNRKDQTRNLIRVIKGRSFRVMSDFLNCLDRISPDVAQRVWATYEENLKKLDSRDACTFCVLKRSVDIKRMADHVWSQNAMSETLYDEIASCAQPLDSHWLKLAKECNQSDHPKKIMDTICVALDSKGHYDLLVTRLRRESKLECRCFRQKVVSFRFSQSEEEDCGDYEDSPSSPNSSVADPRERSPLSDISSHEDLMDIPYDEVLNNAMQKHEFVTMRSSGRVRPKSFNGLMLLDNNGSANMFRSRSNSFGKTSPFRLDSNKRRRASMFV